MFLSVLLPFALSVLLSPVLSIRSTPQPPDPCSVFLTNATANGVILGVTSTLFSSPSLALKCMRAFPVVKTRDLPMLDSVINGMDNFYVSKSIAVDSPDPNFPSSVNIVAVLKGIRAQAAAGKVKTLFDLHLAVYNAFKSLNDGHTWFKSCLLKAFFHMLPLPLVTVVENGKQIVRVATSSYLTANLDAVAYNLYSYDSSLYAGKVVVTIGGKPALAALQAWADANVGMYRDAGTRLNAARASTLFRFSKSQSKAIQTFTQGAFSQRTVPPTADTLALTIQVAATGPATKVVVPWVTRYDGASAFTDSASLWDATCKKTAASRPTPATTEPIGRLVYRRDLEPIPPLFGGGDEYTPFVVEPTPARTAPATSSLTVTATTATLISTDGDHFPVYQLDGTNIVVIVIHTFLADDTAQMLSYLMTALNAAKTVAQQVIFDMRANGGGLSLTAPFLVRLLLGASLVPDGTRQGPQQFRMPNTFTDNLYHASFGMYPYTDLYNLAEDNCLLSADDLLPYMKQRFTKKEPWDFYSKTFKLAPSADFEAAITSAQPFFGTVPFLVLTQGDCFSTCAIFTHHLKKRFGIFHVALGGLLSKKQSISSSCLSFTMTSLSSDFIAPIQISAYASDPKAPQPFPYNVDVGMAFAQQYVNNTIPCEFAFLASDARINVTMNNLANPVLVWGQAATYFT